MFSWHCSRLAASNNGRTPDPRWWMVEYWAGRPVVLFNGIWKVNRSDMQAKYDIVLQSKGGCEKCARVGPGTIPAASRRLPLPHSGFCAISFGVSCVWYVCAKRSFVLYDRKTQILLTNESPRRKIEYLLLECKVLFYVRRPRCLFVNGWQCRWIIHVVLIKFYSRPERPRDVNTNYSATMPW